MTSRRTMLVFAVGLLVPAADAHAQEQDRNQLTIDATVVGAEIGYARRTGASTLTGVQLGGGGSFVERMLIAGDHFSEGQDDLVFEMVSASAFVRTEPHRRWQVDIGVRTSAFLHFDDSDDDPGGGLFYGAYVSAFWGWENVRIGPRVLIGMFDESIDDDPAAQGDGSPREFGVHVAPLNVRAIIDW